MRKNLSVEERAHLECVRLFESQILPGMEEQLGRKLVGDEYTKAYDMWVVNYDTPMILKELRNTETYDIKITVVVNSKEDLKQLTNRLEQVVAEKHIWLATTTHPQGKLIAIP